MHRATPQTSPDRQTDTLEKQTDTPSRTDGRAGQTGVHVDGRAGQTDGRTGYTDGCARKTDGRSEQTDGQSGQMDVHTDGRTGSQRGRQQRRETRRWHRLPGPGQSRRAGRENPKELHEALLRPARPFTAAHAGGRIALWDCKNRDARSFSFAVDFVAVLGPDEQQMGFFITPCVF